MNLEIKWRILLPKKWIYAYANKQLIKIKSLGNGFIEQPDNKSNYTIYDYDNKARVVSETKQLYYDESESFYYNTTTKYNDSTNTSVATTRNKKDLVSTVKTQYTNIQKPLQQKRYDGRGNKLLQEEHFTYNESNQLIKYQVKNSGMGTECPDGGNFTNTITYSDKKLIDRIFHHYKKTICELRFVYK